MVHGDQWKEESYELNVLEVYGDGINLWLPKPYGHVNLFTTRKGADKGSAYWLIGGEGLESHSERVLLLLSMSISNFRKTLFMKIS